MELDTGGPTRRGAIWLGDLVRAFAALDPQDDAQRRDIMALLRLEQPAAEDATDTHDDAGPHPDPTGGPDRPAPAPSPTQPHDTPAPAAAPASQPGIISRLERIASGVADRVALPTGLGTSRGDQGYAPPPFAPLFVPRWVRGILGAALATDGGDGPVDVDRVVELLVRRQGLTSLPRLPWPTLRRGVQVLTDVGPAMAPFSRDQASLLAAITQVIGTGRIQTLRFVGCPSRGVTPGTLRRPSAYSPPPAGTVVLLLTDLGIGRAGLGESAMVQEWEALALTVRRAGCPLIALVPYSPRRWPPALARAIRIVYWDRPTTAGAVRRRLGRLQRAGRW
jgi:hypothetical protein